MAGGPGCSFETMERLGELTDEGLQEWENPEMAEAAMHFYGRQLKYPSKSRKIINANEGNINGRKGQAYPWSEPFPLLK